MIKKNEQPESFSSHYPVMLTEMLQSILPKENGKYLDCTYGAGGYTNAILNSCNCYVTALDQDPTVEEFVKNTEDKFGERFKFVKTNFADARQKLGSQQYDGIVLDLGISSMQVDLGERGFSFTHDGALDMRMSGEGESAAEFIAEASEEEIANVIYKYGEEVQSRQIAKNIVRERAIAPIDTTLRLAEIIRSAMHFRKAKIDPATKAFQGIRIHVNKELESLEKFLKEVEEMLIPGGRLVIVSFHSLEDSIVKGFFKENSIKKVARSKYSTQLSEIEKGKWLKIITKKPIVPSLEELKINNRSRSAKLRIAEKIGGIYVAK